MPSVPKPLSVKIRGSSSARAGNAAAMPMHKSAARAVHPKRYAEKFIGRIAETSIERGEPLSHRLRQDRTLLDYTPMKPIERVKRTRVDHFRR
ncbi:hypothetical protein [Caballeronia sp. LZ035]|uniref:hypothetical protein n=1 Tax=Caballeronia sp. LZ035 TaxID=3038568 RepID=UPI002864066F|nr:hypothetical protein [Caballeronia sp. LZ035]MDR5763291.1 hypothetical protein [Caballeronia sp. LZ035]